MRLPLPARLLLRWFAPADRLEDLLGDLEEVHRVRVGRRGRWLASLLTNLEAVEMAGASTLMRLRHRRAAPTSWLDFKLGLRMLMKYPGLTLVGGLAMAFGIFAGAACFEFYSQVLHPTLPFEEGDRIVDLTLLDDRSQQEESRLLHDFASWRTDLSSIRDLGAARGFVPYLVTGDERGEPMRAAAMTASGFRITRVPPFLGRTLLAADESPGAPNVLVIGYDVWRIRFGADPDVVGRSVLLGDVEHTIVGVMPRGFGFPVKEQLWVPLRFDRASLAPLQGPQVLVFGRLAPGATFDQARTELSTLVARARAERPDAYEHLHARVLHYPQAVLGITRLADRLGILSINVFAGLFLILLCGNVALLTFARAAAREAEIVVRTALGASRRRIVGQLFSEALVLGTVAGLVGMGAAGYGLERFTHGFLGGGLPAFWLHTSLSPRTVVYAAALTVFAAVIAGVVPGLKITSGKVDSRLRRASAGGGGLRFGGVWTAVIVVQVAATVTFPVVGWFVRRDAVNIRAQQLGFPSEQYLAVRLHLNPRDSESLPDSNATSTYSARYASTVERLEERLEAEPRVRAVTMTANVPGTYHNWRRIELDEGGETPRTELDEKGPGRWVYGSRVAPDFFDALGAEPIQGRTFDADDTDPEARTVIVNQPFVDKVLGGRNPIGRHLRYLASPEGWDGVRPGDEPGPWYRIVGVVPDLAMTNGAGSGRAAGFYHAVSPERSRMSILLVHVSGAAPTFADRIHEIAAEVEPDLAIQSVGTVDQAKEDDLRSYAYWIRLIAGVCGLAMLLSLAGIYAVMSFTVARRTREIGVRVALGAGPARVAGAIFRRPLVQVGGGLLMGLLLSAFLGWGIDAEGLWGKPLVVLLGYAALMTMVCLLACIVPVRRALRVEPTEALAADG